MPHCDGAVPGVPGVSRGSAHAGSLAALLSLPLPWQGFRRDAYLAEERQDLIKGVEEFLDCSIVLPPCEIQNEQLLRSLVPMQKELLRKRYLPDEKKPEMKILKGM